MPLLCVLLVPLCNFLSCFLANTGCVNYVTGGESKRIMIIHSLHWRYISGHCGGLVAERVYFPQHTFPNTEFVVLGKNKEERPPAWREGATCRPRIHSRSLLRGVELKPLDVSANLIKRLYVEPATPSLEGAPTSRCINTDNVQTQNHVRSIELRRAFLEAPPYTRARSGSRRLADQIMSTDKTDFIFYRAAGVGGVICFQRSEMQAPKSL